MYLQSEAKCPYCHIDLGYTSKRKTKCKSCENDFYIRTKTGEKVKIIVTEKEREEIDILISIFNFQNTTEKEFVKEKKSKENESKSDKDILWGLLNKKVIKYSKQNNWESLSSLSNVYDDMGRFLREEGKDSFEVEKQARKFQLMSLKHLGAKTVTIHAMRHCKFCKKLEDKEYTIEEALEEMPIPPKECHEKNGIDFCPCDYVGEKYDIKKGNVPDSIM